MYLDKYLPTVLFTSICISLAVTLPANFPNTEFVNLVITALLYLPPPDNILPLTHDKAPSIPA